MKISQYILRNYGILNVMRKKVLIVGNSAKEYALAKIMSKTCDVYVAPGNDGMKEFAVCVDIRETSSQELLEFVLENRIDMTIPVSSAALERDRPERCRITSMPRTGSRRSGTPYRRSP